MQVPLNLDVSSVEEAILDKMAMTGIRSELVVRGIENNHHNALTTIYYLLRNK